jgi:hypothetical protein
MGKTSRALGRLPPEIRGEVWKDLKETRFGISSVEPSGSAIRELVN